MMWGHWIGRLVISNIARASKAVEPQRFSEFCTGMSLVVGTTFGLSAGGRVKGLAPLARILRKWSVQNEPAQTHRVKCL